MCIRDRNDTVSNSENKSRKLVGVSSIDEVEKEWRDNLKGEQGVKFLCG